MMKKSHVIEVNGVFLGAAIRVAEGFRFVAVDQRVGALHGSVAPTLEEARRAASSSYHLARPARAAAAAPPARQKVPAH